MIPAIANTCGVILAILGTILLWNSSPSGYTLPHYASADTMSALAAKNRSMTRGQWSAIGLMALGAVLQIIATWVPVR